MRFSLLAVCLFGCAGAFFQLYYWEGGGGSVVIRVTSMRTFDLSTTSFSPAHRVSGASVALVDQCPSGDVEARDVGGNGLAT